MAGSACRGKHGVKTLILNNTQRLNKMQPQFYNIINDELRGSEKTHQVTDPRTEEELWPCPIATTDDFEDAVAAAQRAFTTWSKTTVPERQAALVKLADVLKEHADELASILMKETGKSVCHQIGKHQQHQAAN
jgi:acyl-CoA reductase-like NAD-dependent aldehyde dehydrogenase